MARSSIKADEKVEEEDAEDVNDSKEFLRAGREGEIAEARAGEWGEEGRAGEAESEGAEEGESALDEADEDEDEDPLGFGIVMTEGGGWQRCTTSSTNYEKKGRKTRKNKVAMKSRNSIMKGGNEKQKQKETRTE